MRLPPEVNLLAVAHYLEALEIQRKANQIVAILGSKTPHIQNLAVGGVANAINLDSPSTLNMEKLYKVKDLLDEVQGFVTQCYLVDVAAVAGFYPEWFKYGAGVTNYLAVPDLPVDAKMTKFDLPGGVIMAGQAGVRKIESWNDAYLKANVTESIAHSHYDGDWQQRPVGRGDRPQVHRRVEGRDPGPAEVQLGQGAPPRGEAHAGGPAGPGAGRLPHQRSAHGQVGRRPPSPRSRPSTRST